MQRKILFIVSLLSLLLLGGCDTAKDKVIKFYGNVDVRTVSLAFQVPGRMNTINFEEGQKVKKGDVIATLDAALYKEQLAQIDAQVEVQKAKLAKLQKGYRVEEIQKARANMNAKKALFKNAQKKLHRYKKLIVTKATSQERYDSVETAYERANALYMYAKSSFKLLENGYEKEDIAAAKAELDALLAQKNQRQLELDYTTLYAPSNGMILTRIHEVGSIINESSIVVELAKEDAYWVRSYMSEKYLGRIKQGMEALVYTDSGGRYKGVVSFISPLAEFTPKSVQTEELRTDLVYRFRIILHSYDTMIKQGMPVTIEFPKLK